MHLAGPAGPVPPGPLGPCALPQALRPLVVFRPLRTSGAVSPFAPFGPWWPFSLARLGIPYLPLVPVAQGGLGCRRQAGPGGLERLGSLLSLARLGGPGFVWAPAAPERQAGQEGLAALALRRSYPKVARLNHQTAPFYISWSKFFSTVLAVCRNRKKSIFRPWRDPEAFD